MLPINFVIQFVDGFLLLIKVVMVFNILDSGLNIIQHRVYLSDIDQGLIQINFEILLFGLDEALALGELFEFIVEGVNFRLARGFESVEVTYELFHLLLPFGFSFLVLIPESLHDIHLLCEPSFHDTHLFNA